MLTKFRPDSKYSSIWSLSVCKYAWVLEVVTISSFGTYGIYSHSQAHAQEPGTEAISKTLSTLAVLLHIKFPLHGEGGGILCTSKDP